MEPLLSAIASDLVSRALSMVIQRYSQSKAAETEQKLQQLQRLLLRIDATVEEAEGRYITNQAMLLQLEMLRQGMYEGHYMLDTFRYRGHGEDDEVSSGRTVVALTRFSSAKQFFPFPINSNTENTTIGTVSVKELEKMLNSLNTMISDMEEFIVFLEGYPRICQQPYSTYLILDRVMFGRQMEKEMIINFLLRPESAGHGNPGVLPVVGLARVGKSTLVEHVCLDERVRGHFSSIVVFNGGDLGAGNLTALRDSGVIKHQDLTAASRDGRSLVAIELDGDMDEETWRRLYSSAASIMEHGSKIIITSRSEKITSFGTAHQPLRLEFLPREAYWYFFKTLAFGTANPDDHPKLASLGMEIAALMKGSFLGANIVGGMMRANLNTQYWRRLLQRLRKFTSKHLILYGEHPTDRIQKGHSVHIWRMARTWHQVTLCKIYQDRSYHQHAIPKLTLQDIFKGCATDQAVFGTIAWRSSIPPYYTYLATCASQTTIRCSMVGKKRPRQARV